MKRYVILSFILLTVIGNLTIYGQSTLEKVIVFSGENAGHASLNNKDGSLLVSYSEKGNKGIYWLKNKKIIKRLPNVTSGLISPNGIYYSYYDKSNNLLFIFKENGQLINKVVIDGFNDSNWSYDSKYIYWCEYGENYIIYRMDILKGKKEQLLESKRIYSSPITINDKNILFLSETVDPKATDSNFNIVKYDLRTKKIERVVLPEIKDLFIFCSYTISPDGKIAVFDDTTSGNVYVVDIVNVKIIDIIDLPGGSYPEYYSWKNDSSCFIFNVNGQEIDKYVVPKR